MKKFKKYLIRGGIHYGNVNQVARNVLYEIHMDKLQHMPDVIKQILIKEIFGEMTLFNLD